MDERVDRTEVRDAPLSREAPAIDRPSRLRSSLIVTILLVLAVGVGWYWGDTAIREACRAQRSRPFRPDRAAAGRSRHHRQGRHPYHPERAGHGDAARHGHRANPNQRPTCRCWVQGRSGGQEGRDLPAYIDPRPYQVSLEQGRGQLAHDQGLLQQAQTDLKRYQTLKSTGFNRATAGRRPALPWWRRTRVGADPIRLRSTTRS